MRYRIAIGPSSFAADDKAPMELLEASGVEIVPNPFGRRLTEPEIIEHLKDVDGLIAGLEPLNVKVLRSASKLKVIARVGIGMENVDHAAAEELGIAVSNTPEGPTEAVAEMCLTALLALCRGLLPADRALHEGEWKKRIGISLRGTTVLLVGYGRIGKRFGDMLRFFGAQLLVTDPRIDEMKLDEGVRPVTLEKGFSEAEVVSLHANGKEPILGVEQFRLMRKGSLLLNSARGELVDEGALIEALENGTVSGAWFDAFWQEPYSGPLTRFEQVLLTPHTGTYTRQCRRFMEEAAVRNLLRDLGAIP